MLAQLKSQEEMKRDLYENDEIETFDKEDAFEGEHCNICDEELRTGWKSG